MTQDEARRECERLGADHPERNSHIWQPRREPSGEWSVLRIALRPSRPENLNAEQRADEKPPTPDDPRSAIFRNIPPYGAA